MPAIPSTARVIVVAGFLGSGKTSLILGLARALAAEGRRVAVVENESGDRGVDDRLLRGSGLVVREISAGCICCTLANDLRAAVAALIAEHHAEVVIVEPTGVAGPGAVIEALRGLTEVAALDAIGVVDARRYDTVIGINPFFIEGLLWTAHAVAVTKVDLLAPAEIGRVVASLRATDPRPVVVPVDTADPGAAAAVLAAVGAVEAPEMAPPPRDGFVEGVVCSRELVWNAVAAAPVAERVRTMLAELATALAGADGAVPGHLKAFIEAGPAGWLSLSVTRGGQRPDERGALAGGIGAVRATVIAVLATGDRYRLDQILARITGTPPSAGLAKPGRSLHRM